MGWWITSRSGWLLELLTELIKCHLTHQVPNEALLIKPDQKIDKVPLKLIKCAKNQYNTTSINRCQNMCEAGSDIETRKTLSRSRSSSLKRNSLSSKSKSRNKINEAGCGSPPEESASEVYQDLGPKSSCSRSRSLGRSGPVLLMPCMRATNNNNNNNNNMTGGEGKMCRTGTRTR